jgi:hypothetical protein
MPEFWLDTNSLVEPKKGPYGFDIAPGFWSFLERKIAEQVIASSSLVLMELKEFEDELSQWAEAHSDCFVEPNENVQAVVGQIADYVNGNYPNHHATDFLSKADPWIIAQARVHGGKVVTFETPVPPNSTKPKIPNVATVFGVETINIYAVVRQLGLSLR